MRWLILLIGALMALFSYGYGQNVSPEYAPQQMVQWLIFIHGAIGLLIAAIAGCSIAHSRQSAPWLRAIAISVFQRGAVLAGAPAVDDIVFHPVFGRGSVKEVMTGTAAILFDDNSRRELPFIELLGAAVS